MPKVRFCPECSNNFSNYTYVVEKEKNKAVNYLVYSCQSCLYQEKMNNSVRLLGISISNLNTEDTKSLPVNSLNHTVNVQL